MDSRQLSFSSTLGIGVIFAAVPVFLYQGIITLFSTQISRFVPDELLEFFISEMTATGGLMIISNRFELNWFDENEGR